LTAPRASRRQEVGGQQTRLPRGFLVAAGAAVFAGITTEVLPVSLLPQISASLDISEPLGGLLVFAYAIVVAVSCIPLTALSMRWPRRRVLVAALAGMAASNVLFAAAGSYGFAAASRLIGGFAHAGFFSVVFAATAAAVPARFVGRAVGVISAGNALGIALGVPLGTALGTAFGWRWVFLTAAIGLALLAGVLGAVMPSAPAPARLGHAPVFTAVRARSVQRVAFFVVLLMLGHYTAYTYVSVVLRDAGIGVLEVSASLFGYGVAGVLGVIVAASTADRHVKASLRTAGVLIAVALLAFGAVHGSPLTSTAPLILWGLGFGALPTLVQTVALRSSPKSPDAGSALVNCAFNIGIAGGALLGSQLLATWGSRSVTVTGGGLVTASLIMVFSTCLPTHAYTSARATASTPCAVDAPP
jgi:DHA1 family inner membrane transport protein